MSIHCIYSFGKHEKGTAYIQYELIDVIIYSLGARKYAPLDGLAAPGLGID